MRNKQARLTFAVKASGQGMAKTSLFFLFILALSSCRFGKQKPDVNEALTGNWLLLYPDHQRNDEIHTEIYARSQDSIVNLMGLKLLSFKEKGVFQLMDSLYRKAGSWKITGNELLVTNGGKGWEQFNGKLIGFRNNTLQLVEYILLGSDSIRIVWFLKKVDRGEKGSELFEEENNSWRRKPVAKESKAALKKKLKKILLFYSSYFEMVSHESSYFVGSRAALPFRYYQHGAGLIPFNEKDAFSRFFYNREQARAAYDFLQDAYLKDRKKAFPKGENYVIEYAKFFHRLAGRVE